MILAKNSVNSQYGKLYSLQGKKIGIPIFQRFYAWKPQQTKQLLIDLEAVMEDPIKDLYLLDFIYYEENGIYKLADGQQRAVTLNNLIKAIKDFAYMNDIEIDDIDLLDISYDITVNDRKYKAHFGAELPYDPKQGCLMSAAPFKSVYNNLYNDFLRVHSNELNKLIKVLKNNIFVYFKQCKDAEDAFYIFQQINTGGKPLTKDDVIKTALDQYSKIYNIQFDTSHMKDVKQLVSSFYKFKTNDPNVNFDNIQIMTFIKDYVTKDAFAFNDFVQTSALLRSLENNPLKYVISYIQRTTLMDVLGILAIKHIDTNLNRDYLEKVMIPLCMMSIVLTIKGGSPTTFRYLLNDVIVKIKNDSSADEIRSMLFSKVAEDPTSWEIPFEDFKNALGNISVKRNLKKALLILDVMTRTTSFTFNVSTVNLEHIFPQNPCDEWAGQGWPVYNEEARKELVDNIGNYMLLTESVNKRIQNDYLTRKVPEYKAIISRDGPLGFEIDFEAFEQEKEQYIYRRQALIAEQIKNNIPFGRVLIK